VYFYHRQLFRITGIAYAYADRTVTYERQRGDTLAGNDGGDLYVGLDRFGRVADQNWLNTGSAGGSTVRPASHPVRHATPTPCVPGGHVYHVLNRSVARVPLLRTDRDF